MRSVSERNRTIEDFVDECPDPTADKVEAWQKAHPDCANEIMDVAMLMLATSFSKGTAEDHRVSREDVELVTRAFDPGRAPSRARDGGTP